MNRHVATFFGGICLFWAGLSPNVPAQPRTFDVRQAAQELINIDRPRIAVAADGSSAVAFEALIRGEFLDEWHVAVQRFAPSGDPVGPLHLFEPESGCGSFDSWSSDAQHHAEIAFRADGMLMVVMQHSGFWLNGDSNSSEITIGAIGTDGQALDLNPSIAHCEQYKLIFVGGGRQDRPRFSLLPGGQMLVTADGFFQDSDLRNVAIRVLGSDLQELIESIIPHDDPSSQQAFHRQPDLVTNGSLILSTWEECPIVDNQGNANECDIGAQFARISLTGLRLLGGNIRVNAGDPAGTVNVLPSAAVNEAGNSVVVWADTRTGAQGDIFGQRFDAEGRPLGSNFQVSAGEGTIYFRPEVALLDDGRFMVVWTDSTTGGFRARGRQFDAGGTPLTAPFSLAPDAGLQTGQPDVTTEGTAFVYIWGGVRNGSLVVATNHLGTIVGREADPALPPMMLESYPNPVAGRATIRFALDTAGPVTLAVYDLLGREVARLLDGPAPPGVQDVSFDASGLPAGLYLVRMTQGARVRTTPLLKSR